MRQGGGLHHSVLTRIGADLTSGRLAAGDVFSMEQLEARYGVSRTVVREVIKVLESIGVATSRRRVGVTIQPERSWESLSPVIIHWRLEGPQRLDQLREVSELRRGVEPQAAWLAAQRATPEQSERLQTAADGMSVTGPQGDLSTYLQHDIDFHRTLLEASGNALLAGFAPFVEEALTSRTEHDLMPEIPEQGAIDWHVEVAAAVAGGRAELAEETMRRIVTEAQDAMDEISPRDAGRSSSWQA
ncbi:FadR/GntR family transcriptional regulator [Janibacter limosus]|jgi:DNA-binding FadR family transcriptional regulator|uniref:FadR/GntR family transcriptional regulator n=1 Tax=Janibacter limosus TaxID=53458 RepID=UPI000829D4DA|nr:FCD domain-containing protein [Janibacter limosus]